MRSKELGQPSQHEIAGVAEEREGERQKEIRIDKKTLVLIAGIPGSGKSTFAVENFPLDAIVSTDRIRQETTNNPRNQTVSVLAFQLARKFINERLKNGEIVVLDAQNINENTRDQFYQIAEEHGASVVAIFLNVPPEEAARRAQTRTRSIGAKYIKHLKGAYLEARRSFEMSERVDHVYTVEPDDARNVTIVLPPDDEKARVTDREFLRESNRAEQMLATAETGFLKREKREGRKTLSLEAGSVIFAEEDEKGEKFLAENFLPHQVIDARAIAKRLHADIADEAVTDVMQMILKTRTRLNLTTVIKYHAGFEGIGPLQDLLVDEETRRNIQIPKPFIDKESYKKYSDIEIRRDAPDDAPLFLVGDIQGCYKAMRELAGKVRQENLARDEREEQRRTIVFVGDMADRGPYDAEAVIYITALVRSGRAILVKGNHDENLLKGLKGEEVRSKETRETIRQLKERLGQKSIDKIIEMLESAPLYAEWKNLVVVHASLPRILRPGEQFSQKEEHDITHGVRMGFVGGRLEVWKLHSTVAHDPNTLIVGGHTHEEGPVFDKVSGSAILDTSVEVKGALWGMYYPELEFASSVEPAVLKLHEMLTRKELPEGQDLLKFIEYANMQGMIDVRHGQGEYDGLTLASYSEVTELSDLWNTYPVLRHFRGLIIDRNGNIVARPFKKTHKAGDEVPLEKLNIVPDQIFEKANGSLGIVYFWNGKWRVSTKFSFENDAYTKPSAEMLAKMNMKTLDPKKTYLFEIILPNDSHIVDYGGKQELVLLNSIDTESGHMDSWDAVRETSVALGARTAKDLGEHFEGMTVREIYNFAQKEGALSDLEGLMAKYRDENGEEVLVKVKTREYDDKKFVRDRLDWEDILEAFDKETMTMSEENFEKLLRYNFDNKFARAALDARITWTRGEYERITREVRTIVSSPLAQAERVYHEGLPHDGKRKAIGRALALASSELEKILKDLGQDGDASYKNSIMGFLRGFLSGEAHPEARLSEYAMGKIRGLIEEEKKKRGKNAFWIIPQDRTQNKKK